MKNKLSERDLERLFRDKLNDPHITYNDDAWIQMEALLDKPERKKRAFWWWFGGFAGLAAVLLIIFWLKQVNYLQEEHIARTERSTEIIDDNSETVDAQEQESEIGIAKNFQLLSSDLDATISKVQKAKGDIEGPARGTGTMNAKEDIQSDSAVNGQENKISIVEGVKESPQIRDHLPTGTEDFALNVEKAILPDIPFLVHEYHLLNYKYNFSPPISYEQKDELEHHAFVIGLSAGPEWSATPTSEFGGRDFSFDVSINYMFTPKIGMNTGVGYISDNYMANQEDYKPERGFWTRSIAPQSTKARCKIIDIPLGVNYYFNNFSRSGPHVSVSIVSQIMVREVYYYRYDNPDPDLVKNWMGQWDNLHLFSTLAISGGYRKSLGKGIFLNFSPFLNLPVRGIGHGHIKLSSAGLKTGIDF